jgi:hypothetical protein
MTFKVEKTADILGDGNFVQTFKLGTRKINIISFKGDEKDNIRLYSYDNTEGGNEMFRPVIDYSVQSNVRLEIRTVSMTQFSVADAEKVVIELEQVKTLIQEVQNYLEEHGITQLSL